jgi:hypothetical protein
LSREGAARLQPAASEVRVWKTAASEVRADVMMMDVLLVALVQVILLQVMSLLLLQVKAFVVKVEEVLLFSLSSTPPQTTMPQTRPAARVWAWGPKGSGFPIVLPAPGRRCSGPFS